MEARSSSDFQNVTPMTPPLLDESEELELPAPCTPSQDDALEKPELASSFTLPEYEQSASKEMLIRNVRASFIAARITRITISLGTNRM